MFTSMSYANWEDEIHAAAKIHRGKRSLTWLSNFWSFVQLIVLVQYIPSLLAIVDSAMAAKDARSPPSSNDILKQSEINSTKQLPTTKGTRWNTGCWRGKFNLISSFSLRLWNNDSLTLRQYAHYLLVLVPFLSETPLKFCLFLSELWMPRSWTRGDRGKARHVY